MNARNLIAVDYGAGSGRIMAARYDGGAVSLSEVHRFENTPVTAADSMIEWDFPLLSSELEGGLSRYAREVTSKPDCLGIDTWGVDLGFFDADGRLVRNPLHYRNYVSSALLDSVFEVIPAHELFRKNGVAQLTLTTLFRLYWLANNHPELLRKAQCALMIPDLLKMALTGEVLQETTNASTTGLLSLREDDWDTSLIEALGLPEDLFPPLCKPGMLLTPVRGDVCEKLGLARCPVASVPTHDTAAAVVSVPAQGSDYAYLSSGTWSLIGVELDEPCLEDRAHEGTYTNERGAFGEYRFLKNVMGLWILEECRRHWRTESPDLSYETLIDEAAGARPFDALIEVNHRSFYPPGDMPQRIREYCSKTGQPSPRSRGGIVRTILESLALAYHECLLDLADLSGHEIPVVHVVGGGSQNAMLNQMTANATGRTIVAGPVEATSMGNALLQLVALSDLSGKEDVRAVARASTRTTRYDPADRDAWCEAYDRYLEIKKRTQE